MTEAENTCESQSHTEGGDCGPWRKVGMKDEEGLYLTLYSIGLPWNIQGKGELTNEEEVLRKEAWQVQRKLVNHPFTLRDGPAMKKHTQDIEDEVSHIFKRFDLSIDPSIPKLVSIFVPDSTAASGDDVTGSVKGEPVKKEESEGEEMRRLYSG